jgi:D-alanyl-D-alanine-carboxypeptidase/D-alanyl-D-alanine-endopeptidase
MNNIKQMPVIAFLFLQLFHAGAQSVVSQNSDIVHAKISTDNKLDSPTGSIVDKVAQVFMSSPEGVGLSIGVYKDGKYYVYNYGEVERGTHQLPKENTLYPIASITKTFTGALLAQAVIERKVKLDDDIRKYLEGDYPNLEFQGQPIRLYHLINHRSGLPYLLPDVPESRPGFNNEITPWPIRASRLLNNYTRTNFYADLHKVKLDAVPGKNFKYSNTAAMLLGYILENLYGMSYEEFLKAKILAPLQMNTTKITLTESEKIRLVKGYDEKGSLIPYSPDQMQAAGALKTTVSDMLKYVKWQADEKDEAVKLSHKPTFRDGNYSAGLNWQILEASGFRVIWQDGSYFGFQSLCVIYPEMHMGIVILTNESSRSSASRVSAKANQITKGLDPNAIVLP